MECKISVKAQATIIVPDDHAKIQWAIGNASDGDTIFVRAGIYYERVSIINKSVSLVGEDRDSTIIDGNNIGSVVTIRAENVSIEGFTIERSGTTDDYGIFVDLSSGIDISHNKIINNNYGISFQTSFNNVVSGNTIANNTNGINLLQYSSDNVFSGNIISSNDYGISLYYSFSNVFSGNTISSNNNGGIILHYSSYNVFSGNIITNNYYGIYFALSSGNNIIYCNNFINNTPQVHFSDSVYANVWDDGYPSGGNYWSDYSGVDLSRGPLQNENGSDGIGDTPYVVDVNNRDNHPLMGMFSDFSVTLEREMYSVTTVCNSTISEFRFEFGTETGNKIIRFNVTGKDSTVGFCRVMIPTKLMKNPCIVLVDTEEIDRDLLDVSNETHNYLYFTYIHSSRTITIISSKTLTLYNELLDIYSELIDQHVKLQTDLYNLNATYYDHLNNYSIFLENCSELIDQHVKLQTDLYNLNATYYDHLNNYNILLGYYGLLQESYGKLNNSHYAHLINYTLFLGDYSLLQESYHELNISYQKHLNNYSALLGDYGLLQESYGELNNSYQEHLSDYSKDAQNIRNLMYIFAATTAIFMITTIYLSKHAHAGKTKVFEDIE